MTCLTSEMAWDCHKCMHRLKMKLNEVTQSNKRTQKLKKYKLKVPEN